MIAGLGNRFRGKSEHRQAACRGEHAGAPGQSQARRRVSQKTNRQRSRKTPVVRVKRRGKSPPPGAQAPGHEKPHAVQDRTGKPGRLTREASASPSRVLVAPCAGKACRSGDMREMIIKSVRRRGGTKFGLPPPAFFNGRLPQTASGALLSPTAVSALPGARGFGVFGANHPTRAPRPSLWRRCVTPGVGPMILA